MTQATLTTSAFAEQWKIQHTAEFVRAGGHKTVALQFPDGLLAEAPRVAAAVSELCPEGTKVGRRTVFVSREDAAAELQSRDSCAASCAACAQVAVLADSAYNPESVDEVAAAHIGASCIVSRQGDIASGILSLLYRSSRIPYPLMPHSLYAPVVGALFSSCRYTTAAVP